MDHRIIALAALVATPALPCTPATDDLATAALIADGEAGVPTRVHVAFSRFGLGGTVVTISEADVADAEPTVLDLANDNGLVGLVSLAPDTRYVMGGTGLPSPITFTTGPGEDLDPPASPTVDLEVTQRWPEIDGFDSCSAPGVDGGSTVIEVLVTADPGVVGVIARDQDTGTTIAIGREVLTFVSRDSERRVIDVVAVDRAGNESLPVPVILDFGGPGGCSQGDAAPLAVAALPLLLRARRRRRRSL